VSQIGAGPAVNPIRRHSARAILLDDQGRLVLIRRTRPGQSPYWTTAGGGVEDSDASVEAALHRELQEELGAQATGARQVLLFTDHYRGEVTVAHFFVVRLEHLDITTRNGPEFDDPARGAYDPEWFDLYSDKLPAIDLRPPGLKDFIVRNREALLAEAGLFG
jgi:8-oxo-dGTP pyrophosphatase MutT (NUDIX family)